MATVSPMWLRRKLRQVGEGTAGRHRLSQHSKVLRRHSTGLGLSISYDIIKRMGGDITAENRSEGGARLMIVLPALGQVLPEVRTAA